MNEIEAREKALNKEEKEKQKELDKLKKDLEELEKKRNDMSEMEAQRREIEQKQADMLAKMQGMGLTKEDLDKIIEEHQRDMAEWDRVMKEERKRQFDAL